MNRLLGFELFKMLRLKRTYIGPVSVAILLWLLASAMHLYTSRAAERGTVDLRPPGNVPMERGSEQVRPPRRVFLTQLTNVPTFVANVQRPLFRVFLPLLVILMASSMVAYETELGTMRMLLIRPIGRAQLLAAKFIVVAGYVAALTAFGLAAAGGASALYFQTGGDATVMPDLFGQGWGLLMIPESDVVPRLAMSYAGGFVGLLCLAAMAFMFSVIFGHSATAAMVTLAVYFTSYVVELMPWSEPLRFMLQSRHLNFWWMFSEPILPWQYIGVSLAWIGGYLAIFLVTAVLVFRLKDVRSCRDG